MRPTPDHSRCSGLMKVVAGVSVRVKRGVWEDLFQVTVFKWDQKLQVHRVQSVVVNYNFVLVTGAFSRCPRVVLHFLYIFHTIYEEVGLELFRPY